MQLNTGREVSLDEILDDTNIDLAIKHLATKRDSCGPDGVMLSELAEYWKVNGDSIIVLIKEMKYTPGIVSIREIVQPSGKKREIAQYNSIDRMLLRAIIQILDPILDPLLSDSTYAFRTGRGTLDAAVKAKAYIESGKEWVCESDVKDYFGSINHDQMLQTLRNTLRLDDRLLVLIESYIRCQVESYGDIKNVRCGLIQGNPLSPLLSNVFLNSLDHELESEGVSFYRYSDDINAYFSSMDLALGFKDMIEKLLTEKGLTLNHKKGGVFKAVNRKCLGYEFVLVKGALIVQKSDTSKRQIYNKWHREPIKKIDDTYHLVSDGVVTRRDFTLLFQNDETKHYLPIETIHSLNIYSNITFSSGFFEYAGNNGLSISIVNNSGELVGRFLPAFTKRNYKTELLQVSHRENERESLALAKKYQNANIFNLRAILRYYERRGAGKEITETVEKLTTLLQKTNETKDIRGLLILEAQARQMYYRCFNTIISKSEYKFEKRTKRPPKDPINAMISFGNTILYNLFATFIYHSSLDIRFGILHNSFHRPESLNLDLADLFKPVIVDRSIFTVINRNMIDVNRDFVEMENGAVYLSKHGKRIFIKEIENKLEQKVKIKDTQKTYRTLMVEEVGRVESYFRKGETYKPYKYVN